MKSLCILATRSSVRLPLIPKLVNAKSISGNASSSIADAYLGYPKPMSED